MRITADTITDEQIRELREGSDHEIEFLCNLALAPRLGTEINVPWDGRINARARCAEILNQRAKEKP